MSPATTRRTYLDVLRGVAVLIMIEAHVIDSWTAEADRSSRAFGESLILGGLGAPLFLFLAGVAVAMSAGSKSRRFENARTAVRLVQRRGWQIFLLAFVFRFQSFVLSHGPAWTLLKVDILNVMGLAIVATATLWGLAPRDAPRIALFAAVTAGIVLATPLVRGWGALAPLPDSVEGYLRPIPGLTNFTLFPWAAFVPAGAIAGVLLDRSRTAEADRRTNLALAAGGLLVAGAAYESSYLPPLWPTSFWTSSASYFFLRAGLMTTAIGVAWAWEQRPWRRRWSPLQLMGRTSLFIYWIHVEMVYGLISLPLHRSLSLRGAWLALALFSALMLAAAALKESAARKLLSGGNLSAQLSRRLQALMF